MLSAHRDSPDLAINIYPPLDLKQKYTATSYWPSPHVFINVGIVLIIAQCRRIDRLYIIFSVGHVTFPIGRCCAVNFCFALRVSL